MSSGQSPVNPPIRSNIIIARTNKNAICIIPEPQNPNIKPKTIACKILCIRSAHIKSPSEKVEVLYLKFSII